MTAYLILFFEEILDRDEMATYALKGRGMPNSPAKALAVYGRKLVMEGPDFEGVAMLAFADLGRRRYRPAEPRAFAWPQHQMEAAVLTLFEARNRRTEH